MKTKRAQQDIIVTVLLVLIALAAVGLIATFIVRNVSTNTQSATDQSDCLKAMVTITSVTNVNGNATINVRREAGSDDVKVGKIKLLIDGSLVTADKDTLPATLATISYTTKTVYASGKKVEAAVVLEDGFTCPALATFTTA